MIKVSVRTNFVNKAVIADENTQVSTFLSENVPGYSESQDFFLNGRVLRGMDVSKTFAQNGVTSGMCSLSSVAKADNA